MEPIKSESGPNLQKIGQWTVLPLQTPNSNLVKFVGIKAAKSTDQNDDSKFGRLLSVTNLSYDCTQDDVESIFSVCGEIESVSFQHFANRQHSTASNASARHAGTSHRPGQPAKRKGLPTQSQEIVLQTREEKQNEEKAARLRYQESEQVQGATILFAEKSAVTKALHKLNASDFWGNCESSKERGILGWVEKYKAQANIDAGVLQANTNKSISQFDQNELKRKRIVEETAVTDSDGWITVTANNKMRKVDSATGKGVGVISTSTNALLERRAQEKKYELTNFYKFQTREDKKKQIDALQARFEQDKKRLEKMKAARKFVKL